MTMITDPVGDMINRIKNAGAVKAESVSVPHSLLKYAIAEKLKEHGFVKAIEKRGRKVRKSIDILVAYSESGAPKVRGVKRISKPGRRVYASVKDIVPVKYGYGAMILSTPKGVLTGQEARKEKVGGEVLFHIW